MILNSFGLFFIFFLTSFISETRVCEHCWEGKLTDFLCKNLHTKSSTQMTFSKYNQILFVVDFGIMQNLIRPRLLTKTQSTSEVKLLLYSELLCPRIFVDNSLLHCCLLLSALRVETIMARYRFSKCLDPVLLNLNFWSWFLIDGGTSQFQGGDYVSEFLKLWFLPNIPFWKWSRNWYINKGNEYSFMEVMYLRSLTEVLRCECMPT